MPSLVDLQHTQPSSQEKECAWLELGKGIMRRQRTQPEFCVNYMVFQTLYHEIIEWIGFEVTFKTILTTLS